MPFTSTFARRVAVRPSLSKNGFTRLLDGRKVWPMMATKRPPGLRSAKACSMWRAPVAEVLAVPRLPDAENGGFITTTS